MDKLERQRTLYHVTSYRIDYSKTGGGRWVGNSLSPYLPLPLHLGTNIS
jgi:hypothetical protein